MRNIIIIQSDTKNLCLTQHNLVMLLHYGAKGVFEIDKEESIYWFIKLYTDYWRKPEFHVVRHIVLVITKELKITYSKDKINNLVQKTAKITYLK